MTTTAHRAIATEEPTVGRKFHIPGEGAVWAFIFCDLLTFTVIFGSYLFDMGREHSLFAASQQELNLVFGAINTMLLLTGSLFVVLGVTATKAGMFTRAQTMFTIALVCAVGFGVDKVIEYTDKARHGITPFTNDFYNYYYMLTGFHAFHLVIGIAFLLRMRNLVSHGRAASTQLRFIETGASFWHLVDLLWIALFPLLYIIH